MRQASLIIIASAAFILSCVALQAHAAITFDASSSAPATVANGSATTSITVGSGTNEAMVIAVGGGCTSTVLLSATVNGVTPTLAVAEVSSQNRDAALYYSLGNPAGTYNVSTTCAGGGGSMALVVSSYFGVNQATPIDATSSSFDNISTSTVSGTITTNVAGDMIVDAAGPHSPYGSVGGGQTLVGLSFVGGNGMGVFSSYLPASTPGTYTMSWTTTGANTWSDSIVALEPAPMVPDVTFGGNGGMCIIGAGAGLIIR